MKTTVKTLVLTGYGINCEEEMADCFVRAGSEVEIVHLNHLIANPDLLPAYDILTLPGGFSYGDHIACGKNFSNKIRFNIWDDFIAFIRSGKPVLGVCNGYQILVKLGVLPDLSGEVRPEFTFTNNIDLNGQSRFEDRWVQLKANPGNDSLWLKNIDRLELPVRHGEGRLVSPDSGNLQNLIYRNQVAFFYSQPGEEEPSYPANPNGSVLGIAALTNPSGNVLGIMPHPEAYSLREHYPNFLGEDDPVLKDRFLNYDFFRPHDGAGMIFFYNAVNHINTKKCGGNRHG